MTGQLCDSKQTCNVLHPYICVVPVSVTILYMVWWYQIPPYTCTRKTNSFYSAKLYMYICNYACTCMYPGMFVLVLSVGIYIDGLPSLKRISGVWRFWNMLSRNICLFDRFCASSSWGTFLERAAPPAAGSSRGLDGMRSRQAWLLMRSLLHYSLYCIIVFSSCS